MPEAVIVATARTPIGRANKGSLTECRPDDLAGFIIKDVLGKVPALDPQTVEDVILGCGQPGGEAGYNVARVAAAPRRPARRPRRHRQPLLLVVAADDPHGRPRHQGRRGRRVRRRRRRDREPLHARRLRHRPAQPALRRRRGHAPPSAPSGAGSWTPPAGLPDIYIAMGQTAENVVLAEGVTREEMDEWGARSQQRAVAAQERGFFDREITPGHPQPTAPSCRKDDGPRAGTTVEKLAELKPVFRPDGKVTAGNACPLNDGAAAVVVMSDTKANELGITPARPHRVAPASPASTPRSWAWARSRRAARRSAGPASPSTTSTSSRSTRPSPPRCSRR